MSETSSRQFGPLIAYVLPGFIVLVGLAPRFPVVAQWLQPVSGGAFDFGLGPPLYAMLAAMALGLVLSCFRWVLIDRAHHWTGVQRPVWEDSQLDRVLNGFDYLVQNHYRYYEFCGNAFLAALCAYGMNRLAGTLPVLNAGTDLMMLVILGVLFLASRSALTNYYTRTHRLIGRSATYLEDRQCSTETIMVAQTNNQNKHPKPNPTQHRR